MQFEPVELDKYATVFENFAAIIDGNAEQVDADTSELQAAAKDQLREILGEYADDAMTETPPADKAIMLTIFFSNFRAELLELSDPDALNEDTD